MKLPPFMIALLLGWAAATGSLAQAQQAGSTSGAATPAPTAPASTPGVTDSASYAYILGRDDVVEVGLLGRPDFSGRARVQADGTIQLPLIGKVAVADRTAAEVSEVIRKALQTGGFFADPVVTIEVVGYASRYITVLGAVGSPGLIPMNRPYRMSEILARVGGVREGAADFIIVRSESGQERRLMVRDLSMGGPDQDPYVKAGDKIFAPIAEKYYIYGQVNTPGTYPMTGDATLRIAIAKAGGLTASGSDKKVTVTRAGKKVKLDLGAEVQPGDVIEIGERLF